jgi:hypothetical protein
MERKYRIAIARNEIIGGVASLRGTTRETPEKIVMTFKIYFSVGARGRVGDGSGYRPVTLSNFIKFDRLHQRCKSL